MASIPTSQQHPDTAAGTKQPNRSKVTYTRKGSSKHSLTIVIKLGTSSICDEITHFPLLSTLSLIVETILKLKAMGHRVVLVSSGAIGVGLRRMNLASKPKELAQIQAIAAVGQGRLMSLYDDLFGQFNQPIAQILLTKNDLADRTQYLNACNTLEALLEMDVVPIVNENDTISVSEIRFGDNDTLSAITAGMIHADYLFLMTDVDCLYTDNPRVNPDAQPVLVVDDITTLRERVSVATAGSSLGTGGMITKLIAAELATAAGVTTVIARGSTPQRIFHVISQPIRHAGSASPKSEPSSPVTANPAKIGSEEEKLPLHTRFLAKDNPMVDRKWWILHGLHAAGTIYIDRGAYRAITNASQKSSLFAAGIVSCKGTFVAQQSVRVVYRSRDFVKKDDDDDQEVVDANESEEIVVGKGLVNYASHEILRIMGCQSSQIIERLGYADAECVIHRDNLTRVKLTQPDRCTDFYLSSHNPTTLQDDRFVITLDSMEYRRLVSEAHLMVQEFLQSQGYKDALVAFEREASTVLEDIPKSMPTPKPLLEFLTDNRMSQLHSQLGQLTMLSEIEEQDLATPGDDTMPNRMDQVFKGLHSSNIIYARTVDVVVAPTWQDLELDPEMKSKRVPALVTSAADRTVKFTLLNGPHGEDQAGDVFKILTPHQGVVLDMDFHPRHPELMLTSAMDKTVVLTNTITGDERQIFKDQAKFVVRARFAMDGAVFITGSHDHTVNIYKAQPDLDQNNLPRYILDKTLTFKGAVEATCVLPSSTSRAPTVVIGTRNDNYLYYVDLTTYNIVKYNMNINKDDWVSFTPLDISASPHNDDGYLLVSTDSPTGRQIMFRTDSAIQLFNYYGVPTDGFSRPRHVWHQSGKYFYVTGDDYKIYRFQLGNQPH
ncbi:hypothetical protein BGZ65_008960, partial [Modicella reniformis]